MDRRVLTSLGRTTVKIQLGKLMTHQTFVVSKYLSAPVILGCDFLTMHRLILDFRRGICHNKLFLNETKLSLQPTHSCNLVLDEECPQAVSYPASKASGEQLDMLSEFHPTLGPVLRDHEALFQRHLGRTDVAEH